MALFGLSHSSSYPQLRPMGPRMNLLMAWAGAQAAWSIALDYDFAPYAGRPWSGRSELAAIGGALLGLVAHAGLGML